MDPLNKVAPITFWFWVMKILATTLGETSGDFLSMTLNLGYVVSLVITLGFFLMVLTLQLRSRGFHPALYWAVIVGTTTAGTEVSDLMDRTLKLGYTAGSLILSTGLLAALAAWYLIERNLEVYPILERRQEIFYWTAVLLSNSLGTAFGDFLSDDLRLSYRGGALVTAGIIGLVIVLHTVTRIHDVALFWIAFVFTRPFGATFGDLLTKPAGKGGMALGTLPASLVTLALLALVIAFSSRSSRKKPTEAGRARRQDGCGAD